MKNTISILMMMFVFIIMGCMSYPEYSYRNDFSQLEKGESVKTSSRVYKATVSHVHKAIVKSIVHFLKQAEAIAKNTGDSQARYVRVVANGLPSQIFLYPFDIEKPMRYEVVYEIKRNKIGNIFEYPERAFIETKQGKTKKEVEVTLTIIRNKNNKNDIVPFTVESFLNEIFMKL